MSIKIDYSLSEKPGDAAAMQQTDGSSIWNGRIVNLRDDCDHRGKLEVLALIPWVPQEDLHRAAGSSQKYSEMKSIVIDPMFITDFEKNTLNKLNIPIHLSSFPLRSLAETWLLGRINLCEMQLFRNPSNSTAREEFSLLTTNLGFLLDPLEIPFTGSLSTKIDPILETLSKMNSKITWTEAYRNCRQNLASQLAAFAPVVQKNREEADEPRKKLYQYADQLTDGEMEICKATLGSGGAYFCYPKGGELKAVLKTVNGDVGTIDNQKGFNHPFQTSVIRPTANYESVIKEALAYELSLTFECEGSVPPTILTIIKYQFDNFFDHPTVKNILKMCPKEVKAEIITRLGGKANPVRLCSLQEAVENPLLLTEIIMNWGKPGFESLEFNQDNFDDVIFMTRLLGETDGNFDNYLLTKKVPEQIQVSDSNVSSLQQYFLVKIDSSFCLPKENSCALNCLTSLPNAKYPISTRYRQKVLATDSNKFKQVTERYKLDKREITAALERIEFMKDLVRTKPNITHREFELRLRLFSGMGYKVNIDLESRKEFALKDYSMVELKTLKGINRSRYKVNESAIAASQVKAGGLVKIGIPWRKEIGVMRKSKILLEFCTMVLEKLEKAIIGSSADHKERLKDEITIMHVIIKEYEVQLKSLDVFTNNLDHGYEKSKLMLLFVNLEKLERTLKSLIEKVEEKSSIPSIEEFQSAHKNLKELPQSHTEQISSDTYITVFDLADED